MPGVKGIQMQASLIYEDDYVITIGTPVWSKDIRDGDLFTEEQIKEVITGSGEALSEIVEREGTAGMYKEMQKRCNPPQPVDIRKPKAGDGFSLN